MKKILLIILLFQPLIGYCQKDGITNIVTLNEGRYQITQINSFNFIFKLDKQKGLVYTLNELDPTSDDYQWKNIPVIELDYDKVESKNRNNYYLFIYGQEKKLPILINIYTGKSWLLTESKRFFEFKPIKESSLGL